MNETPDENQTPDPDQPEIRSDDYVWVNGYVRPDGFKVRGYWRHVPWAKWGREHRDQP